MSDNLWSKNGTDERERLNEYAPDMASVLLALIDAAEGGSELRFIIPGVLADARRVLKDSGVLE